MKIFNVYTSKFENIDLDDVIFVEDDFSWLAFLFNIFCFLIKKMWLYTLVATVFFVSVVLLLKFTLISEETYLLLNLIGMYFSGCIKADAEMRQLEQTGYKLCSVIVAKNLEQAKIRFLDNLYIQNAHTIFN